MKSLIVLSLLLLSVAARGQWQPTTFHAGTFALAWNGKVLVASDTSSHTKGFDVGVLYSSDLGQTWHRSETGPKLMFWVHAVGESLYGSSYEFNGTRWESSLWESNDDARTWTKYSTLPGYRDFGMNDYGFLAYSDATLDRSRDGKDWERIPSEHLPYDTSGNGDRLWVTATADSLILAVIGTGSDRKFYSTRDFGDSWQRVQTPWPATPMAVFGASTIYMAPNDGGLYRSRNYGTDWDLIRSTIPYWYWWSDGRSIFGTNRSRHILSTDGGDSWQTIDTTDTRFMDITAYAVAGGYLFAAVYCDNIYRIPLLGNAVNEPVQPITRIYPNPATRSIFIEKGEPGDRGVVIDAAGRKVLDIRLDAKSSIDISMLPAGSYTLAVKGDHFRLSVK